MNIWPIYEGKFEVDYCVSSLRRIDVLYNMYIP